MQSDALTRREAAVRTAATACLAGVALVQALELPAAATQGRVPAVLSGAAMTLCVAVAWALAAAPASAGKAVWKVVAITGGLVLAGWALPRVAYIALLPNTKGTWSAPAPAVCAGLAVACLVLAAIALRPGRTALRGALTAVAVLVALTPAVGALLVALGPEPLGGEAALASGAHVHQGATFESNIKFKPGSGRNGSHYVYEVAAAPPLSPLSAGLTIAAVLAFTAGAAGALRRRSAPEPTDGPGISPAGVGAGLA